MKLEKRTMSRGLWLIALAMFLLLALIACAPAGTVLPTAVAQPTSAPQATSAPPPTTVSQATTAPSGGTGNSVTVWWWGEQEAAGLEKWMDETVKMYAEKNPNVKVETVLQSTEALYPAFHAAAQAKKGPDVQYLWSGIYTMEDVWAGNVAPISDLAPDEVQHIFPSLRGETAFEGKTYGLGWYMAPILWAYNKELFTKAGLDATKPPVTWADLLTACEKLKAAGISPIGYGFKGASGHGNFAGGFLVQELDNSWELLRPTVGDAKFTDPKFGGWFARIDELNKKGCFNNDIMSLDYQGGMNLFPAGQVAMTIAPVSVISGWEKDMGADKLGTMLPPVFGKGKAAGTLGNTAQQLTITTFAANAKAGADFIAFMHTPERLKAMYDQARALPPDDRFDTSAVQSSTDKQVLQWAKEKGSIWYQDYLPSMIDREAVFTAIDKVILGEFSPEQAAQSVEDYAVRWRGQNADSVATLKKWLAGVEQ